MFLLGAYIQLIAYTSVQMLTDRLHRDIRCKQIRAISSSKLRFLAQLPPH